MKLSMDPNFWLNKEFHKIVKKLKITYQDMPGACGALIKDP